jgi:hypothetical protein
MKTLLTTFERLPNTFSRWGHAGACPSARRDALPHVPNIRKILLAVAIIAAALSVTVATSRGADRPSSDEVAVRMGVDAWFALWSQSTATPDAARVRALYAAENGTQLPTAIEAASRTGLIRSGASGPDNLAVTMGGDRAVSAFRLQVQEPSAGGGNRSAQVVLTWERRAGLWQIVHETIQPSPAAERVALSQPKRLQP